MKLTKIHVENFGGLHDYTLEPQAGLNRLEYPNGWGKSTLANFLCAMLFGLRVKKSWRQQYLPWQGGVCGGYVELSSTLGDFRIERTFDAVSLTRDTLNVIDRSTGRPTTLLGEIPGETLFGINVEGFEKSAYLTQSDVKPSDNALSSITDRLHKLLDNVEDAGSYDRAKKTIEKTARSLRTPSGGTKLQELELQCADLNRKIEQLTRGRADLKALEAERDACQKELADLEGAKDAYRRRREIAARLEERKRICSEIERYKASIESLEQAFCGRPLSKEEEDAIEDACKNLQAASSYASTLEAAFPQATYDTLIRRYPAGIPDESAIARAEELASKRKANEEKLKTITKGKEGAKQSLIPALLPVILSLMAACGALAGILLGAPALAIPFLAVGILLLALPLAKRKQILRLREELAELDKAFGEALPSLHAKSADEALCRRVREDASAFGTLQTEYARLEDARAKRSALAEKLSDFYAIYGTEEDRGDPAKALERLQNAERKIAFFSPLLAEKESALAEFDRAQGLTAEEIDSLPAPESLEDWDAKKEELTLRAQGLERQIGAMSAEIDRIPELSDTLDNMRTELRERSEKMAVLSKTFSYLQAAKDSLSSRYRDGLERSFPRFLQRLSGGNAPEASIDTDMNVLLYGGGKSRPVTAFSKGMQDLTDFCLRLSLTEALTDAEEPPFLLLDDPFVNLDDDRYEAARALLDDLANSYQIFYFVCRRERD